MVPRHAILTAEPQRSCTGNISTLLSAWNSSGSSSSLRSAVNGPLQVKSENFGSPESVDFSADYSPLFPQNIGKVFLISSVITAIDYPFLDSPNQQSLCDDNSDFMDQCKPI